jgi:hypothetical protein
VRVQDCLAQGAAGLPGVRIEGSGDIALCMTQALGGSAWPQSGEGVLANGTAFAAYECDLHGAAGAPSTSTSYPACHGGTGGSGLRGATAASSSSAARCSSAEAAPTAATAAAAAAATGRGATEATADPRSTYSAGAQSAPGDWATARSPVLRAGEDSGCARAGSRPTCTGDPATPARAWSRAAPTRW